MAENLDFLNSQNFRNAKQAFEETPEAQNFRNEDAAEKAHGERVETQVAKERDGNPSIFSSLYRGVQIGATDAVNEIDKTFGISNALKNHFGLDLQLGEETFLYETEKDLDLNPRNTLEAMTSTFSQFLLPFGPAVKGTTKITKMAGLLSKSPKAKILVDGLIAGAPVDAFAFDPKDPNLGNFLLSFDMISKNPTAQGLLKDYLATDPADSDAINRSKNALTGGLAGVLTAGLIEALRGGVKAVIGSEKGAAKTLKEAEKFSDAEIKSAAKEQADEIVEGLDKAKKELPPEKIQEVSEEIPARETPVSSESTLDEAFDRLGPEDQAKMKDVLLRAARGELDAIDDVSLPFNLKKLTAGDDILKTIHGIGRILGDTLPRNIKIGEKIQEFSAIFGVDEVDFTRHLKKTVGNVEDAHPYIEASKAVSGIQTQKALKASREYLAGPSVKTEFAMNRAMIEATETVRAAAGLSTAFGRGLAQFKKIADLADFTQQADALRMELMNRTLNGTDNLAKQRAAMTVKLAKRSGEITGKTTKAIKKVVKKERLEEISGADLEQLKAMSRFVHQGTLARTRDGLLEIYINGLLSRPETQVVNILGSVQAITASIFERSFAGLKNTSVQGVAPGEASQMILSYVDSLKDVFSLFGKAVKEGPTNQFIKSDFLRPHSRVLSKETWGIGPGAMGSAIDLFGSFVNLPGKLLISADDVFKTMNYRAELNALGQRNAVRALGKVPRTAEDFVALTKLREKLVNNPTNEMVEQAHEFARVNTFTNKLPNKEVFDVKTGKNIQVRGFTRNIQRAIEAFPTSKVFIPFFQTPVNLLTYAFHRTPILNKFSKVIQREMDSPNLAIRQLAQAKTATGIAMYTTGIGLGLSGVITGAPPLDANLRRRQEEAGWKPYSIMFPDGPISYNRFDPLGGMLAVSANMSTMAKSMIDVTGHGEKYGYTRELFEKYQQIFADATVGTARIVADRNYLQGFGMLVDFLSGDARGFRRGMETLGTAVNPGISLYSSFRRGLTRGITPERELQRTDETVLEEGDELEDILMKEFGQAMGNLAEDIVTEIPGYGNTRSPARNLIGDPTFYPGSGQNEDLHLMPYRVINQLFNPAKGFPKVTSALLLKVGELDMSFEGADQVENIQGIVLNDEERDFFAVTWGGLNKRLESWVGSEKFNKLPEELQKELLLSRLLANKGIARRLTQTRFKRIRDVFVDDIKNSVKQRQNPLPGNDINNLFSIN